MKTIIFGLLTSLIVHLAYIAVLIVRGFNKTKTYVPSLVTEYDHNTVLSHKVTFGSTFSPFIFVFTFIGLALLVILLITLYKKIIG